tara:strand:+ start:782 stop:1087 length:306 start_codon:yes stop_codon:yes gene_type:complete
MTEETYKYCEHKTYGVGAAQLTQWRKDRQDDLWMVTFQSIGQKQKWFFCTKHFTLGDEIEFIDEARATELYKQGRNGGFKKRTKTVRKKEINLQDLLDSLM